MHELSIAQAVVDTDGFRFGKLTDYRDPNFMPGGAKYGDLPGILSLSAPDKLLIMSDKKEDGDQLVVAAYKSAGKGEQLRFQSGNAKANAAAAIGYLLEK